MQHGILTLIRHAETTGNLNRLLQGVTDSPVTVYGQAQIDALAKAWATTTTSATPVTSAAQEAEARVSARTSKNDGRLDLPPPTLIVCSPIGRARKTAEAVFAACSASPVSDSTIVLAKIDAKDHQSSPTRQQVARDLIERGDHPQGRLQLVVDFGLAEKDFGWKESTRGGVHVAGFPKGHGAGESKADFVEKVRQVGLEWLQIVANMAQQREDQRPTDVLVGPLSDGSSPEQESRQLDRKSEERANTAPHIVLVSHGMWISHFLSAHPPTVISQTSGQPGFLPFAANTGMFSLRVASHSQSQSQSQLKPLSQSMPGGSSSSRPRTDLFKANDIQHLTHVKRQKGGIGRGAFDSSQTKLSSFFSKPTPPAKAQSPQRRDDQPQAHSIDATNDALPSPTKKRRT